jgi:hypothetical protein
MKAFNFGAQARPAPCRAEAADLPFQQFPCQTAQGYYIAPACQTTQARHPGLHGLTISSR